MDIQADDQSARASLIADLEGAIKGGSEEKRVETLRRVTDLFLGDAVRLRFPRFGEHGYAEWTEVLRLQLQPCTLHRLCRTRQDAASTFTVDR